MLFYFDTISKKFQSNHCVYRVTNNMKSQEVLIKQILNSGYDKGDIRVCSIFRTMPGMRKTQTFLRHHQSCNKEEVKMKQMCKCFSVVFLVLAVLSLTAYSPCLAVAAKADKVAKVDKSNKLAKANAVFDVKKMADMSDFDPGNPVIPTGDTIKIAVVAAFSGPSAYNGQIYYCLL